MLCLRTEDIRPNNRYPPILALRVTSLFIPPPAIAGSGADGFAGRGFGCKANRNKQAIPLFWQEFGICPRLDMGRQHDIAEADANQPANGDVLRLPQAADNTVAPSLRVT